MDPPFPIPLWHLGPVVITDVVVVTLVLSASLLLLGVAMLRMRRIRLVLELGYDALERAILDMVSVDAQALVPLILTLWLFIGAANLVGLVPGVLSPTRDLSLTAALAFVSFFAGHVFALRTRGLRYLRQYVEPHPLLLPFNIIGELSRTVALALRLFGAQLAGLRPRVIVRHHAVGGFDQLLDAGATLVGQRGVQRVDGAQRHHHQRQQGQQRKHEQARGQPHLIDESHVSTCLCYYAFSDRTFYGRWRAGLEHRDKMSQITARPGRLGAHQGRPRRVTLAFANHKNGTPSHDLSLNPNRR